MTATSASVQFATGGMVEVQSSLRLTGDTYVNCYTYDDHAPILGIDDVHVTVSITVPDTSHVTADDVTWARLLAATVTRYVTELEQLAPASRESPVDEARRFLESSRRDEDALYTAYVLILVLGLRKGEVLGLSWARVDLEAAELYVGEQLQRVTGQLIRRQVKTESSEAPLPLPELCVTALKLRSERQAFDRERAGGAWVETGLVFTSRHGTPVEPSNFDRSFDRRIAKATVPKITRHSTRKTCGSLLAALEVHPRVAMQILRHSKIAITMEIYTEVPSAATREALHKLGQWLDETGT